MWEALVLSLGAGLILIGILLFKYSQSLTIGRAEQIKLNIPYFTLIPIGMALAGLAIGNIIGG